MTFNSYRKYRDFLKENPNFTGVCVVFCGGKKWFEYNRVNGKRHGKQFGWRANGQKRFEHNFVNGLQIGIQLSEGETCEEKPEDNSIWHLIVKENL